MHIFYFQDGGRPPSWIWYDVIADHPLFVFDGHSPKIACWSCLYFARYRNFYIRPTWLELPIHDHLGSFWGTLPPKWILILSQPQMDRPWVKTRGMSHKLWKSIHGSTWVCAQEKIEDNKEVTKLQYFTYLGRSPSRTDWNENLHWCRSRGRNHISQVQIWKISGILMSWVVKIRPFSLTLHTGLTTA